MEGATSEPSSGAEDALSLFSLTRSVGREPSSEAPVPADTSISSADELIINSDLKFEHGSPSCFVEIPRLSSPLKSLYLPLADREIASGDEYDHDGIDRIVGELQENGVLSYYVRYHSGIVYQVRAQVLEKHQPQLVEDYEHAAATDSLLPFDPTSSDVHPGSRRTLLLTLPGTTAQRRVVMSQQSDSETDEMLKDWDDDEEAMSPPGHRRQTRSGGRTIGGQLPFSPKKTRSGRHAIVIHDSASEDDDEALPHTRRSTRARKSTRANLDDGDFADDDFDESDDSAYEYSAAQPKPKKLVRAKTSRAAYGHFRFYVDLEDEEKENVGVEGAALLAHRKVCEKCQEPPTMILQTRASKRKGKRKTVDEDEFEQDDDEKFGAMGGWVRCLKCPVTAHWGCLAKTQRDEILRAASARDRARWLADPIGPEPGRRVSLEIFQTTEFICGACMRGGICMGCKEVALKPDQFSEQQQHTTIPTGEHPDALPPPSVPDNQGEASSAELLFRCRLCKRLAHYAHLPVPDEYDEHKTTPADLAEYYQNATGWRCADCTSYVYAVELILAWRPYPENAVETPRNRDEVVNYKTSLPREYLVKWADRSYRRTQWVPHMWLLATSPARLKNFLVSGPKVALLPQAITENTPDAPGNAVNAVFELGADESDTPPHEGDEDTEPPLVANPDAENKIPPAWKTVHRVLDVLLWAPPGKNSRKSKHKRKGSRVDGETDDETEDPVAAKIRAAAYDDGEEPRRDYMETIEEFEARTRERLSESHADLVVWAFMKWDDLGYDDATWDAPPRPEESGYSAFKDAFKRFLFSRSVVVPARKSKDPSQSDVRRKLHRSFTAERQPALGQNEQLKLMPFQVDGVNWLCHNWLTNQSCILADEMGLGKTVQIVTFIGYLVKQFKCYPALVVVPNSTISNWVREFERWAPGLRVVPFYGEAKAREVIKRFELFHAIPEKGNTNLKYHVLIATYEMITNAKEFTPVFKNTPRWEVLVIDEGQRLKSDESLIFKKLKELKTFQRVIMTGTPLNNNIRELFNLMNFLDPEQWQDLENLSKQYEELTDELITDLHARLKPYFLRRIKSEVLDLPPKNEVIVPVTMAPLQREIYRSILSQNLTILQSLAQGGTSKNQVPKTNMNNILMQLRKCLQHPYLVSDTIEPKGLSPQEMHDRLIGASAKLRMLKLLLPKLKARGHRVLLFSQFVIGLNIVEDFLAGEGIKYLRLDGNTKQAVRQKDMDEFNKPGSDVFIYLLTTRAGGVGINLWSADTVIIYDPDFNPHQDLQAIARAHRFGQKKTVLVFKLMVKDSAEERIMQTGKKKLVLDHLIVQKMDDETGNKEDVQSILMFGAKALFEEGADGAAAREIHYSEHDIDNLIEKTEKEGDKIEPEAVTGAGSLFAFAKVWSADKDGLEEMPDEVAGNTEEADAWTKALELIAATRANEQIKEVTGRGVRRKAAAVFPQQNFNFQGTPTKDKDKDKDKLKGRRKKQKGASKDSDDDTSKNSAEDSDFHVNASISSDSSGDDDRMDVDDLLIPPLPALVSSAPPPGSSTAPKLPKLAQPIRRDAAAHPLSPIHNQGPVLDAHPSDELCGLCNESHPPGQCPMTESPQNLARYRLMLLLHSEDEPVEDRRTAIKAIDETLKKLGMIHLIYGQPLQIVDTPPVSAPMPKKQRVDAPPSRSTAAQADGRKAAYVNAAAGPSRVINIPAAPSASVSAARGATSATSRTATGARSMTKAAQPSGIAGPSKRPSSPGPSGERQKTKKAKDNGSACRVCGRTPHHLVKDCPIVAQGSKSIDEAIKRLQNNNNEAATVETLQRIKLKQQRHALASSTITGASNPSG